MESGSQKEALSHTYHLVSIQNPIGRDRSWDFPMVLWLRIHHARQGTWIQFLIGKQRFHMPWSSYAHIPELRECTMEGRNDTTKIPWAATETQHK